MITLAAILIGVLVLALVCATVWLGLFCLGTGTKGQYDVLNGRGDDLR